MEKTHSFRERDWQQNLFCINKIAKINFAQYSYNKNYLLSKVKDKLGWEGLRVIILKLKLKKTNFDQELLQSLLSKELQGCK